METVTHVLGPKERAPENCRLLHPKDEAGAKKTADSDLKGKKLFFSVLHFTTMLSPRLLSSLPLGLCLASFLSTTRHVLQPYVSFNSDFQRLPSPGVIFY